MARWTLKVVPRQVILKSENCPLASMLAMASFRATIGAILDLYIVEREPVFTPEFLAEIGSY